MSVSLGMTPFGVVAASKSLLHASVVTSVTQPERTSASVAKLAIVGVCALLSGPRIASPHPPLSRSTKLGTFPAAMRRPSSCPFNVSPSRNCADVQTDATVVNSFTVTVLGGVVPSTASSAMALLATWAAADFDVPPLATTYRTLLPGILGTLSLKLPLSLVVPWANCAGAPALAAYKVTVDPSIGLLAP